MTFDVQHNKIIEDQLAIGQKRPLVFLCEA